MTISKMSLVSTPPYLDSYPVIFRLLGACMSLPTIYLIYPNTANKTIYKEREKDSPKPKKTAKG